MLSRFWNAFGHVSAILFTTGVLLGCLACFLDAFFVLSGSPRMFFSMDFDASGTPARHRMLFEMAYPTENKPQDRILHPNLTNSMIFWHFPTRFRNWFCWRSPDEYVCIYVANTSEQRCSGHTGLLWRVVAESVEAVLANIFHMQKQITYSSISIPCTTLMTDMPAKGRHVG